MTSGSGPSRSQLDAGAGPQATSANGFTHSTLLTLGRGASYACGLLILLVVTFVALGIPPGEALGKLWSGAFGDAQSGHLYSISETLVDTTPLLLTGLSVIIAWRTGLFSIGAEGQLLVGALAATIIGLNLSSVPGPLLTLLTKAALLVEGRP